MPLTFILLITQIERLFFAPPSVSLNIERDIEEEKKKKKKEERRKSGLAVKWRGIDVTRNRGGEVVIWQLVSGRGRHVRERKRERGSLFLRLPTIFDRPVRFHSKRYQQYAIDASSNAIIN